MIRKKKRDNMLQAYTDFTGQQTIPEILSYLPSELTKELSGRQIGLIMNAIDKAFLNGRESLNTEIDL